MRCRLGPEKKKHERQTPEQRFNAQVKAVNHDPLKGELPKDEFIKAVKQSKSTKMAEGAAEEFFRTSRRRTRTRSPRTST